MGRTKDLNEGQIAAVTALLKYSHHSQREISKKIGISKGSVSKIAVAAKNGSILTCQRKGNCGAKRKTSARVDRLIVKTAIKHSQKPTRIIRNKLRAHGIQICARTIVRRLAENGIKTYRPTKKPKLNKLQMLKRKKWAKKHQHWTVEQWRKVK